MERLKTFLGIALLVAIAGCATTSITNLTPTQMPRSQNGQYLVEMKMDTQQQTMRPDSITPYVVVGFEQYKMRPTLKMADRWETYVPIDADHDSILYHFKVNYAFNRFGKPGEGSLLSQEYKLTIK